MSQSLPPQVQIPPSAQMMEMIFAYTLSRSIATAAQFGIADQLIDGAKTADEIAAKLKLHPRSLYRLLRALAGAGVFHEDEAKRFSLTPLSETLRSDMPESLRGFAGFMADDVNFQTWAGLPYSVETGERAFDHIFGSEIFPWYQQHPAYGEKFDAAMTSMSLGASMAVIAGYDFTGIKKLVDIGGGQGQLLAAVLQKYPTMQGVLYDAPHVIATAHGTIAAHGVTDRCEILGGDFFVSAPAGGDAYIMKHIIHDWSDDECVTILGHCRDGMNVGDKVLIAEMIVPEPNAPGVSKFLDLQMLLVLSGCERTADEYRNLLDRAGFAMTRIVPTPSLYSVIEGVKK